MQTKRSTRAKFISLLFCALLLFSALSGCRTNALHPEAAATITPSATAVQEAAPVQFTDMGDNRITLASPATRIVALTPADVEILYAIGAGDTLVGCGEYCDYPPEAAAIPVVQTGVELNMEMLLSIRPEVLLLNPQMLATSAASSAKAQVERLASEGITVVISNALDIAGVYEAVEMLGTLTGREAQAATIAADMRAVFAEIADTPMAAGKTVYFEISPLEYGLWTAGSGTFMHEIAEMIGLSNCFADVSGYGEISEEQVLARDPDYIVTVAMYFGAGFTPEEEIAGRPGWQAVAAVENGAILSIRNNALSRPGPRLAEGAGTLRALVDDVTKQ